MSSKWTRWAAALAATMLAAPASAQSIAYINALQFDLQSFRNQATAGIFWDDIEYVPDAARLLEVEGNRIFTNLSNLHDPAIQGDRLLTYSLDQIGNPTTGDVFDNGSFLGGWIGRTSDVSNNVFSIFYQMNGSKTMFEDLEDGDIDSAPDDLSETFDAEYRATTLTQIRDTVTNGVIAETEERIDLKRFDDRTANDLDFGLAREVSADLSVGGRVFYEEDALDVIAEGTTETITRDLLGQPTGSPVLQTGRTVQSMVGPGEDAFKQSEIGLSFDADFHQWADQSLNVRFDIFGTNLTNPGMLSPFDAGGVTIGSQVSLVREDTYTTVFADPAIGGGSGGRGDLDNDHENRSTTTTGLFGESLATVAVDDERTGIGLGAKLDYDREWAGGESRTWVAFEHKPFDIDATVRQQDLVQETYFWNGAGLGTPVPGDFEATYTELELNSTVARSGDQVWSTWELGTRWTKDLSNSVSFGGSFIASRVEQKEDYDQRTEITAIVNRFDDGSGTLGDDVLIGSGFPIGPELGDFSERQTVTTSNEVVNVDDEQEVTTLRLPVGLQFHFAKKWTWNMGSLHEVNWIQRETTVSSPAGETGQTVTTTTDFSDPTPPTPVYGTDPSSEGVTVVDKDKIHSTTFFYGIEWDPTENLSFYINGMFEPLGDGNDNPSTGETNSGRSIGDVDFWRSLSISAKVIL